MDTKALRQKILHLAIHGKLVPQDPADEPASALLRRIRGEKERLIKEGKIKKGKKSAKTSDTDHYENVPFEVPKSWEWTTIGNIGEVITGNTPSKDVTDYYGGNIPFFKPTDLEQGIRTVTSKDHLTELGYEQSRKLPAKSVLVTCIGATIGKTGLIETDGTCNQQINAVVPSDAILSVFLYYLCISNFFQQEIKENASATTLPILNKNSFAALAIPLPPLAEQRRIVAEIERLFSLIDIIESGKESLRTAVKQAKAKILNLAIHGKLVPQDPNDEPAGVLLERIRQEKQRLVKEGKLKKSALADSVIYKGDDNRYWERIGKDTRDVTEEIPFEIPSSWSWGRVKGLVQMNPKNEADDDTQAAFIPMEKIAATYGSEYTYDQVKWATIKKGFTHFANGDVAFAKITPCFQNRKSAIFDNLPNGIGAGTTELKVLRPYKNTVNRWFLLYFLESPYFVDEAKFKGTANQQRIVTGYLGDKLFPLPPLAEQRRIVAKIEELFARLDSIEANLR